MTHHIVNVRRRFFDGSSLPDGSVPEPILRSWLRCRGQGLPTSGLAVQRLDAPSLARLREANGDWLDMARPLIDSLYEQVIDAGHVVIVADGYGTILEESGNPSFLDRAERAALRPGIDWREESRGTNAIGTALATGEHTLVRGREHYLERNHQLSCVAAPIIDPGGRVLGVLDISGPPRRLGREQSQALAGTLRLIEQRLFDRLADPTIRVALHPNPAQLGSARAALLAFDQAEQLTAANRIALEALGIVRPWPHGLRFCDLFGETVEHWLRRSGSGIGVLCRHDRCFSARIGLPVSGRSAPAAAPAPLPRAAVTAGPQAVERAIDSGLPAALMAIAAKLLRADVPVLLLGETGTGKDCFARALHAASDRQTAPFVAVNCAAIPETLAEAELFGYEPGAFTGARRQGSRGRLREAHGGVLFLDEIGDMPLTLQARLLRVLQDRTVTPLGGGTAQPVDIRLVCATHRDLRQMVESGAFRADLYFRLCHYPLRLPPLRERADVAAVAQRILDAHGAAARGISLAPELAALLRRYRWPGNLRELSNLLTTLLALADDGTVLTSAALPDDLRRAMCQPPPDTGDSGQGIAALLERFGGNASAAARALGISRSTLYRRLGPAGAARSTTRS